MDMDLTPARSKNGSHTKIIAAAAKAELGPLGFKRQGLSRLWLKDHGFWLNIVEFTPSPWSVSVDLSNAAHWLWGGCGFMSLNYFVRRKPHAEFRNEDQFRNEVSVIARIAATEAVKIDEKFASFGSIAQYVTERAQSSDSMRLSWFGYYAGVAGGILGNVEEAEQLLRGISDKRVTPHAQRFLAAADSPTAFRQTANEVLAQQRAALKLPVLAHLAF